MKMKKSATPWSQQSADERRATVRAAMRLGAKHVHPAWALMHAKAYELRLPRSFQADLFVHDRRALEDAAHDARFVWAIFEAGTYFHWIARKGDRRMRSDEAHGAASYLESERAHIFEWEGTALAQIDRERAHTLFLEEHNRSHHEHKEFAPCR
jgi:hypothetical protein